MANAQHLALLQQGSLIWNAWRGKHPEVQPDLRQASLRGKYLEGVNLAGADLREANLYEANLSQA
ncbi:MAG TPA: pentapeptide repeat-containing protein, partial [Candidatus Sericytochromatia bacterium]